MGFELFLVGAALLAVGAVATAAVTVPAAAEKSRAS